MDENESNKRENSMLGPQGTGHAQNFAKGDSQFKGLKYRVFLRNTASEVDLMDGGGVS